VRSRLDIVHRQFVAAVEARQLAAGVFAYRGRPVEATYEATDLAALTRDLASTFGSAFELAGLELDQQLAPLSQRCMSIGTFGTKSSQLVSNAFKYTLRGRIDIHRLRQGREL